MKKFIWPLLIIFFFIGGLVAILIGQVVLPPEPRPESVQAISEKWTDSGHADSSAEAFVHWDEDDPPEIPAYCAQCHSAYGYRDFLGEDGSQPNTVDTAAKTGSVISCFVCHNPSAHQKDSSDFPSGVTIEDLGTSANCVECHQGLSAGVTVEKATIDLPEDEISEALQFINVHYNIAGATSLGAEVAAGYEYPNMSYTGFYPHVSDYQSCTDCHDPHSLEITVSECAACHPVVSDYADIYSIRVEDTPDFDGDGDLIEGVYSELTSVHDLFYAAIQQYAREALDTPILYASQFPYWFNDTNGNGEADPDELIFPNQYQSWSPRLLKAAYNYHLVLEDPGGFMHNARYLIQLMFDSMHNLSEVVEFDMGQLIRPE